AENRTGNAVQAPIVAAHQHAHGRLVALPCKGDQNLVRRGGEVRLDGYEHVHGPVSLHPPHVRRITLLRMISSTDGKAASATSGSGSSPPMPGPLPVQSPSPGSPTTMRPTMPACSCGTQ